LIEKKNAALYRDAATTIQKRGLRPALFLFKRQFFETDGGDIPSARDLLRGQWAPWRERAARSSTTSPLQVQNAKPFVTVMSI